MINKNGGLFYGTLIDTGNLSAVLRDIDNTTITANITCSRGTSSGNAIPSFNNSLSFGVIRTFARIGYGKTLPTIDDYCLSNEVDDGVNINDILLCVSAERTIGDSKATTSGTLTGETDGSVYYSYTFYNNSNKAITFYEIGQFVNTATSLPIHPFMTARNVNENGWTVKPNENITLTIELNYASGEVIVQQGARFFTNLFTQSNGMYGFKNPLGTNVNGSIQAVPNAGSNTNTQATNDNTIGTNTPYGIFARLGMGQTPMDISDYCLENEMYQEGNLNTTLTCNSARLEADKLSTGMWKYIYTFSNTSASGIRFFEVGLFMRMGVGTIMIGRKVNDAGWYVEGNGAITIEIDISICGATNSEEKSEEE